MVDMTPEGRSSTPADRDETDSDFVPSSTLNVLREFALDRFAIAALFCCLRGVGEHHGPRNAPPD